MDETTAHRPLALLGLSPHRNVETPKFGFILVHFVDFYQVALYFHHLFATDVAWTREPENIFK
jgi:hypothetical protein